MFALAISLFSGYLIGSIPTGFIFAKIFAKRDIRTLGSGNVGATNVYRVVGKIPGVLTLLIDIAKGAVVVSVFANYSYQWGIPLEFSLYQILLGLAAVSGHIWTPFLKFKGGKGIATSGGVLLIICPKILVIVLLVWIAVFALTKIVSIASIVASISFPAITAFTGNFPLTLFSIILCVISVFKHRTNISRLMRGEEKRLNL